MDKVENSKENSDNKPATQKKVANKPQDKKKRGKEKPKETVVETSKLEVICTWCYQNTFGTTGNNMILGPLNNVSAYEVSYQMQT